MDMPNTISETFAEFRSRPASWDVGRGAGVRACVRMRHACAVCAERCAVCVRGGPSPHARFVPFLAHAIGIVGDMRMCPGSRFPSPRRLPALRRGSAQLATVPSAVPHARRGPSTCAWVALGYDSIDRTVYVSPAPVLPLGAAACPA